MNELISHAIAFLIGTATGAAGAYFADKFTDQRRSKELVRGEMNRFKTLAEKMPDLIAEIREDLDAKPMYRDAFVKQKGVMLWASERSFVYEDDGQNDYFSKFKILESNGYVYDITPKNAQMYRFTEEFVELVKEEE